jgi:quinohemoprotein ethanol dehydrogenase
VQRSKSGVFNKRCGPRCRRWYAASPPSLADITFRGQPRKSLMHPGKTGWLYLLDRTTGRLLNGVEEKPVPQERRMKTAGRSRIRLGTGS